MISRAITTSVSGAKAAISSIALGRSRAGQNSACVPVSSSESISRQARAFLGMNPWNMKRSVGNPLAHRAAMSELGPGIGITG